MTCAPLAIPAALPNPAAMPAIGRALSLYLRARTTRLSQPIAPEIRERARRAVERALGGR